MEGTTEVKILGGWASPFVMRTCMALNLKNIPYEFFQEDVQNKSEFLLKSNPVHKKIPVLLHNDKPVCESLNIVQYVDECFPGPSILPSGPYERSIARFWAAYVDDKWFGLLCRVTKAKTDEEKKVAIEGVIEGLVLLEKAFQEISQGKDFFGGDKLGYVDLVFGCCLGWLEVAERLNGITLLNESDMPGLHGWSKRFYAHDAVKTVMPDIEKLTPYVKALFEKNLI